jgi:hypothetical protein
MAVLKSKSFDDVGIQNNDFFFSIIFFFDALAQETIKFSVFIINKLLIIFNY